MKPSDKSGSQRRIGLARTLSKLGYCSRAQAFELVRAARVAVASVSRRDPEFPVRPGDTFTVDGQVVLSASKLISS